MGILNSAHECNRPLLLDFLFLEPPLPAAIIVIVVIIVIVIVVIVVFSEEPTYHLVEKLRTEQAQSATAARAKTPLNQRD